LADVGGHHVARPPLVSNTFRTQSRTSGPSDGNGLPDALAGGTPNSRIRRKNYESLIALMSWYSE